nr:hypothetical protein [Tanacetum cinerariifolium]
MSRVRMLRVRTFSRAGNAINLVFIQVKGISKQGTKGYIGGYVLGTQVKDMVGLYFGNFTCLNLPFEELSDIGSPRADDNEYLMMLEDPYVEVALQAPPSPDYMPGPEEPEQAPPSPDYVTGPEHADDEIVAEDQPYVENASPIAQSPEYVPESDFGTLT